MFEFIEILIDFIEHYLTKYINTWLIIIGFYFFLTAIMRNI